MAVVSSLLILQAIYDFKTSHDPTTLSKSIFYSYLSRSKQFAVTCNLVASFTFGAVLVLGMAYITDQVKNHHHNLGDEQTVDILTVAGTIYPLFLVERIGSFVLNSLHFQFEFEMMRN